MRGIANARFNMRADILRGPAITEGAPTASGHWETYQDEDTGEILERWVETPGAEPPTGGGKSETLADQPCTVRSFLDTGYRTPANLTDIEKQELIKTESVEMWTPAFVDINEDDRVTNVRSGRQGETVWKDVNGRPTIFDVKGVNPVVDSLGRHIENMCILRRVPVQ